MTGTDSISIVIRLVERMLDAEARVKELEGGRESINRTANAIFDENQQLKQGLELAKEELRVMKNADFHLAPPLNHALKDIGSLQYRGNTVSYIYDKCEKYGKELDRLNAELAKADAANKTLDDGNNILIRENIRLADELCSVTNEKDTLAKDFNEVFELYRKLKISRSHPNPALENVLAKLRNFLPFIKGEADQQGIQMVCCGVQVGVMSVGDLRRWVESEVKS